MKRLILSTVLLAAICTAGQAQKKDDYYVKHVEFPQGATLEQKVDMALLGTYGMVVQHKMLLKKQMHNLNKQKKLIWQLLMLYC